MYDLAVIETINTDQLVTATDRLLVRGRLARLRVPNGARRVRDLGALADPTVVTRPCAPPCSLLRRAALFTSLFSLTALLVAAL